MSQNRQLKITQVIGMYPSQEYQPGFRSFANFEVIIDALERTGSLASGSTAKDVTGVMIEPDGLALIYGQ